MALNHDHDAPSRPARAGVRVVALALGALAAAGIGLLSCITAPPVTPTPSPTATATPTPAAVARATPCAAAPSGWRPYTVRSGDTLWDLAALTGASVESVQSANCLHTVDLQIGQTLYLPPLPTPAPTACVPAPPAGWLLYIVRAGDTLASLSQAGQTTAGDLIAANCLTAVEISPGQALYVPPAVVAALVARAAETAAAAAPPQPTAVRIAQAPTPTPFPRLPIPLNPPRSAPTAPAGNAVAPASSTPVASGGEVVQVCAGFLCRVPGVAVPVFGGDPNDFYTPCATPPPGVVTGTPWISRRREASPPLPRYQGAQLGSREYLFACGFSASATLEAEVTGQDITTTLTVVPLPLDPRLAVTWPLPTGTPIPDTDRALLNDPRRVQLAQGVAIWPVTCDLTPGPYTVTMHSRPTGERAQIPVAVITPLAGKILAVPQIGPANTSFRVWYCEPQKPAHDLVVHLYFLSPIGGGEYSWEQINSWQVPVDKNGFARQTLPTPSTPSDVSTGMYYLRAVPSSGRDFIWVTP